MSESSFFHTGTKICQDSLISKTVMEWMTTVQMLAVTGNFILLPHPVDKVTKLCG
jgi:hypothetical protein